MVDKHVILKKKRKKYIIKFSLGQGILTNERCKEVAIAIWLKQQMVHWSLVGDGSALTRDL